MQTSTRYGPRGGVRRYGGRDGLREYVAECFAEEVAPAETWFAEPWVDGDTAGGDPPPVAIFATPS